MKDYYTMIEIALAGVLGKRITVDDDTDWLNIYNLAKQQNVLSFIYLAIKENKTSCPSDIEKRISKDALTLMVPQIYRYESAVSLYNELKASGMHPVLLKGLSIAHCYRVPEARFSCDVDILILPQEENTAIEFFKSKNYIIYPRRNDLHHFVAKSPLGDEVEIHINLFGKLSENVWLKRFDLSILTSKTTIYSTKFGDFESLSYTENFIYLCLHIFTNFAKERIDLKMCIDIAIFDQKYGKYIDWKQVKESLEQCNATILVETIRCIMANFGLLKNGQSLTNNITDQQINLLLEDITKCGNISNDEYNNRVLMRKQLISFKMKNSYGFVVNFKYWLGYYPKRIRELFVSSQVQLMGKSKENQKKSFLDYIKTAFSNYRSKKKCLNNIVNKELCKEKELLRQLGIVKDNEE